MISRFIAVLLGLIATALLILLIIIVLGQQQAYADGIPRGLGHRPRGERLVRFRLL
jgi:hypothetical protein